MSSIQAASKRDAHGIDLVHVRFERILITDSTPHYKPEPLSLLLQVKAAALVLGNKRDQYGDREHPYDERTDLFREEFEELRPGLFGFLTGSNKLRYLFLAAPILYYQESLIPCWAKGELNPRS